MSFVFPEFLFALSVIIIPVIIHLFNFRKFKKVYFSNVSFLKEIQQQTSSVRNVQNRLLLLTRVLIIVFLVLAFAKPFIPAKDQQHSFSSQIVSIYIDNSYSMETLNKEGSLLDEAKRRAKEIASVYSLNDKYQLLTNDFEGKHQRLLSYEDFLSAVDEVKISGISRSLQQIVNRQQEIFSGQANTGKTIYILSDFQKNMLSGKLGAVDPEIAIRFMRMESNQVSNISVDSVWFASPIHRPNGTERLVVQLRNNSDRRAENVSLKVFIDGKPKALGSTNIESRTIRRDTLSFSGLNAGWKRGEVKISDYPIVFDDNFYFSFNVQEHIDILAINTAGENKYIQALYTTEPFFNYKSTPAGSINYAQISSNSLIILTSTEDVSTGLATELKTYVKNGGSLMVFPSLSESSDGLNTLTQTLGTDVPQVILTQEAKVISINLHDQIFKGVFSQTPQKMDLPVAKKFVQYRNTMRSSKQSVLKFSGNNDLLGRFSIGKGKVYLSAVALSEESSNFVQHSLFVPIMYQAAFLSLRDPSLAYTIGSNQFMDIKKISLSPNQTLKLKKDNFEIIPDLRASETGTRIFISDQVKENGIYELVKNDSLLAVFAFNDNRAESDLSYLTKADLKEIGSKNKIELFSPQMGSVKNAIKAVNNGIQLWKLCLILALVFLATEILIARYYKTNEIKT